SSNYTLTSSDAHKYLRVVVTASDGKGGTQTATSAYTAILNSAPVLSTDARSLTTIDEDATGNNGDTVAAILASAGSATDVDGNALGIAITATDTGNGTWQYKTGAGSWTTITGVSGTSALLLASTDRVRFVPNTDYNGSVASGITFKAWDQTSGTAGTTVGNDTTTNGGQGAGRQFSADSATAGLTVTAVNDAPVLTDTVLTLPSVAQAAGVPDGAVGVAVSSLVTLGANVSDVDSGAVTGIALVGVDASEGGTWFYSTDGGTSWTAVGTVNDSGNALLLRTTDRLYYQPTGAKAGILSAAITFRAWDQSSGTAGTKVATAGGGGISAFSTATDTASLAITPAALASTVSLAPSSDTGVSNSDNITKASSVTFDGSGANANTTVRLYANGSLLATATADASGAYSFTGVDVSAYNGAVDFTVRQAIAGMESADSATRTVTFDRTVPTVAITTVTGDNVLSAAESAVPQTVAGTTTGVEDGQTVTVTLNGKSYTTTVTNNAWSLAIPSADLLGLTDGGTYAITADLTDVAGNAAVQATRNVSVDRTAPTLAIATVAGDNVLNAADSAVGQTVSGVTNGVEDGQTVTVTLNGKSYTTTVTNNAWSLTVPSVDLLALTDGSSYTVTASLTDAAGNPTQATRSVSVDRTAPTVAITTVTGDNVLSAAESAVPQTVAGTTTGVEDGQTVTVTLNGKSYTTTVTNNAWSLAIPSADLLGLTDGGTYAITADLTDVAGNAAVQATRNVSVDRTAPTLAIATVAGDNVLNAADSAVGQTVSGVTNGVEDGQTVTVTLNGKTYTTTVTNNAWSLTVPSADLLALTDGASYTVTASLTDAAGNPTQATRSVAVDRTVPTVAITTVTGDNVLSAAESAVPQTVAGTTTGVEDGQTVTVTLNGKTYTTTVTNNAWSLTVPSADLLALTDGASYTVTASLTDAAGNPTQATRSVAVDRTVPTVAITTVTGDNVLSAAESAVPQTVAGTTTGVEDGQTVTVTLNGKSYSATVTNNAWSLAIPSADLLGLTDGGTYAITADLTDVAGNAAVQATRNVSVDRTAPTLAIATVAGDNVLNAADSAVGQTVSGVTNGVEDGQTVTVTLNGKSYTTTVANSRWSLTVPSVDLLALTDGANYTVTASLTDAAGNPNQATRSVAVDRTPPSVVSVTPPPARTYLPGDTVSFFVQLSEASIINGGAPVLELAVGSEIRNAAYNAAGSTATLLRFDYVVPVGDRAPQGIAVLGLALNGSIVTDAAQGPLVTTLKGVGDTSQVRIDTPIPAKPVGTALSGLSDSGASATDRLTNVTRPTLSGTAEPNATVTVMVDGKAVGTTVADENGFWVHRLQTALTDGTHSVTTTATNRFGIVSDPSDALVVVIDTAVPVTPAPSVTSATVAGATAGERISGIATPTLAGTTEAGSTVSLLVDGKIAGTAVADVNGAWTFQFTAALADGTHSLQVQATDRAGNVSSLSAATTLTIDTTPPAAPTVTLNTTAGSTPVVQGTAEANSLVSVTINGQPVGTARAGATGSWQLALAADLSVGSYVISAKASDAVGNTGNAGTTTYSVAPPPPPPVVVVAASTGNTTTAASSSSSAVGAATGTGVTQTTGPTLGTAPTLPGLQTSSDAGRVITSSSISSGGAAGNGNSSTDAGRSITIGAIGNSTSSDAGRSITISAMGGAPSGGGTASSSSGVLGGGTGGSSNSGLSGVVSGGGLGGALGGGVGGGSSLGGSSLGGSGLGNSGLGNSGLGGAASGGLGAGPGAAGAGSGGAFGGPAGGVSGAGLGTGGPATGGPAAGGAATGAGTGNGGLNGGVGQGGVGPAGAASGGAPGGTAAPGGPGTAAGGLGSAPGNRPGGQTGPGSTIENAPGNRPANSAAPQGRPQGQGQPQGQPPAGDAPSGGDPGSAPAAPDGQAQAPGPRADLDGSTLARPAFSRQVAQIHGAADAQSAALLAALTTHVPPGSRAA
ncbi:beta strand repeat-containing protein, partial [Azospirillum brasilense]|uniref:beta strand repeat-containing protein n=1 Tax=Azospirillum brasilense TaxID=192 RepID=UPI001FFF5847